MGSEAVSRSCSTIRYLSLVLIPFTASFSSSITNILIAFAIGAFLIPILASDNWMPLKQNPLLIPFSLMMLASMVSFIHTIDLKASVLGMVKLLKYLGLFLAVTEEARDIRHAKGIITALLMGVLLSSLDGLAQLYFGQDFLRHRPYNVGLEGVPRLRAAFPHTNHFSTYLALFLPLSICLTFYEYRGAQRLFAYATSVLALFCLLFTFARGSFLGFLIALTFIGVVKKEKMIFVALLLMMAVLPFAAPSSIRDWQKTNQHAWEFLWDPQKVGDWRNALNMIRHNPLFGVGVNTYSVNLETYKVKDGSRYQGGVGYAHNIYLHMMAEIGPVGLASFLWLVFRLFKTAFRSYRCLENNFLKTVVLGTAAGLMAFLYNGITETVLYHSKIAPLFWFTAGLLLGASKLAARPPARPYPISGRPILK